MLQGGTWVGSMVAGLRNSRGCWNPSSRPRPGGCSCARAAVWNTTVVREGRCQICLLLGMEALATPTSVLAAQGIRGPWPTTVSALRMAACRLSGYRHVRMVDSDPMRQMRLWFAWIAGDGPRPKIRSASLVAIVLAGMVVAVGAALLSSAHSPSAPHHPSALRAPTAPAVSTPRSSPSGPTLHRTTTTTVGAPKTVLTTPTTQALSHHGKVRRRANQSRARVTRSKVGQAKRHSPLRGRANAA